MTGGNGGAFDDHWPTDRAAVGPGDAIEYDTAGTDGGGICDDSTCGPRGDLEIAGPVLCNHPSNVTTRTGPGPFVSLTHGRDKIVVGGVQRP